MLKTKECFRCTNCSHILSKWQGQCPSCQQWNTIEAFSQNSTKKASSGYSISSNQGLQKLDSIQTQDTPRFSTNIGEFDRVLGGGLVPGSVTLIGGDPGIGKSSILLQMACYLSQEMPIIYVSGEESASQIALRAKRIGLDFDQLHIYTETQVEAICECASKHKPSLMIIDSIQTMHIGQLSGAPGGVSQVRESAAALNRFAKENTITLFMVGHVTKSGEVAGPRVLEHIVDCVIYLEGQQSSPYRLMRAIKNRFGAANELGVFAMGDHGLQQIDNPSKIFLSKSIAHQAGSVVMATWEGTRPLLVELQALVDKSYSPNPRRLALGLDGNRLAMLLAVLHRHGGLMVQHQDIFVNEVVVHSGSIAKMVELELSTKNETIVTIVTIRETSKKSSTIQAC